MNQRKVYSVTIKNKIKVFANGISVEDIKDLFIKASEYFIGEYKNLSEDDLFVYEIL